MDTTQERRLKAMAGKIRNRTQAMESSMQALAESDLSDVSEQALVNIFNELEDHLKQIQSIMTEGLLAILSSAGAESVNVQQTTTTASLGPGYRAQNQTAEEEADKPVDYAVACSQVVAIDRQDTCKHPTDSWIHVFNVPMELRQYQQDDLDWLCGSCGKLVPPF